MKIAYLYTDVQKPEKKERKPSKKEVALARASRWAEIQSQRNYRAFLKKYADRISAVREVFPEWVPDRPIKK
ncbi:hypothetical protein [Pedobacter africanus]|uniref:Uncharacterized protein n=1 Tax=Pedobacter africanus TaxID=151894 RepID=A0A1W1ZCZ1_9SPHI|nr:hypothetical protein [Pedobacter africanus]SMC46283.1 hypothetical protein SAMN04488524_0611 [Pedobacter africanus]